MKFLVVVAPPSIYQDRISDKEAVKLEKVISRVYIGTGELKILTNYFSV